MNKMEMEAIFGCGGHQADGTPNTPCDMRAQSMNQFGAVIVTLIVSIVGGIIGGLITARVGSGLKTFFHDKEHFHHVDIDHVWKEDAAEIELKKMREIA